MPIGEGRSRLRELYPTIESYDEAIDKYGSQIALSNHIGVSRVTLYHYRKWLSKGKKPIQNGKRICRSKNGELDKKIREMFSSECSRVDVYKLTDAYIPGQKGTEGLEYKRTDISPTALSQWARNVKI